MSSSLLARSISESDVDPNPFRQVQKAGIKAWLTVFSHTSVSLSPPGLRQTTHYFPIPFIPNPWMSHIQQWSLVHSLWINQIFSPHYWRIHRRGGHRLLHLSEMKLRFRPNLKRTDRWLILLAVWVTLLLDPCLISVCSQPCSEGAALEYFFFFFIGWVTMSRTRFFVSENCCCFAQFKLSIWLLRNGCTWMDTKRLKKANSKCLTFEFIN